MPRAVGAALLALAALAVAGCGTDGMVEETADPAEGKAIFQQTCGGCHTLREAGTNGSNPVQNPSSGPNLDDAFAASREEGFAPDTIAEVVRGQIDYPVPPMPEDLLNDADADAVALYVSLVAANPDASIGGGPGGAGAATTRNRCSRATAAPATYWRRPGPRAPSGPTSTRRRRASKTPFGRSETAAAGCRPSATSSRTSRSVPWRGTCQSAARPVPRRLLGARPRLRGRRPRA